MSGVQPQEIHCGIGIGQRAVGALAPSASAVPRLGAHHPTVRTTLVIPASPAEGQQVIALEDCRCGLDVAQARTNAVAFSPSPFGRIVSEEEGTVARVIQLRVGTDFLIHRQQPLAVCQQDRSVANHGAGLEGHLEGFGPGLGLIARDLGGDARVAPKLAVAGDVKEPNHMVGSLPDHRIAQRVEGVAGDGHRFRPPPRACFQARTEDSRLVVFVFTPTAEKDHEEVAVVQFGEARRVLVVAGLDLGPEESFPFEGRHRQCPQQSQNKDG